MRGIRSRRSAYRARNRPLPHQAPRNTLCRVVGNELPHVQRFCYGGLGHRKLSIQLFRLTDWFFPAKLGGDHTATCSKSRVQFAIT